MALTVSALVTTCFVWSASAMGTPLACTAGSAAFLAMAIITDVHSMRIPNALTFPAFGISLVCSLIQGGGPGLVAAVVGSGLALILFGSSFALGWMGAGDVKATMVLGSLWGAGDFVVAAWWMVVVGGVLAILLIGAHPRELVDLVSRWSKSFWYSIRLSRVVYLPPEMNRSTKGLPFAVAMGLGAACAQIWGAPWA
jgi:prepilin peptidase CpaA